MNETIIFPNLHITLENVGKTFTVFGIAIAYMNGMMDRICCWVWR